MEESKEIIIQERPPTIFSNNQIGKPKKKLNKSKNLAQFLIIRNDGAVDMVYNKHDLKKGSLSQLGRGAHNSTLEQNQVNER